MGSADRDASNADIPVLQMSLPTHEPQRLMDLGRRLQPLRDQGVLIIGSGFMTHGLPFIRDFRPDAPPPGWSTDFDSWAHEGLQNGAIDALSNYRQAPGTPYAHPTPDHYIPLFITLGTATKIEEPPTQVIDGYWRGWARG